MLSNKDIDINKYSIIYFIYDIKVYIIDFFHNPWL